MYKDIFRHIRAHTIFLSPTLSRDDIWECAPVKGGSNTKDMNQINKQTHKQTLKEKVDSNEKGIRGSPKVTTL